MTGSSGARVHQNSTVFEVASLRESFALGRAASAADLAPHRADLERLGLTFDQYGDSGFVCRTDVDWLSMLSLSAALREDSTSLPLHRLNLALSVDSTNDWALRTTPPPAGTISVYVADNQWAGRGQHARRWHSAFASGVCLTLALTLPMRPDFSTLPLVAGLAVRRAVRACGVESPMVKWPNDLVSDRQKLGGVLVQTSAMADAVSIIIGVGLNVHAAPARETEDALLPAPLAARLADGAISRHDVVVQLVRSLSAALPVFSASGFASFQDEWREADALRDRVVTVGEPPSRRARAVGVDAFGRLLLESDGETRALERGRVRLFDKTDGGRSYG